MKKGVLTMMMYLMPLKGQLCLHSSANESQDGTVTVFFGLSGYPYSYHTRPAASHSTYIRAPQPATELERPPYRPTPTVS